MAEQERNDALLTDEVRDLVALIKETAIAEVFIERGDAKLHIKRALAQPIVAQQVVPDQLIQAAAAPAAPATLALLGAGLQPIEDDVAAVERNRADRDAGAQCHDRYCFLAQVRKHESPRATGRARLWGA